MEFKNELKNLNRFPIENQSCIFVTNNYDSCFMKNYRFYFYTIICLTVFFTLVSVFGVPYLLKQNASLHLENQIESGRQRANQIVKISEKSFDKETEKATIKNNVQEAIESTEKQTIFLSIYDWSGEIVSHADATLVGEDASQENPLVKNVETTITGVDLYDYIISLDESKLTKSSSEIIYLKPIKNSDWIVAVHINTTKTLNTMNEWESQTYLIFLIIALLVLLIVLGSIRIISGYYEGQMALKSTRFEDGVLSISKLNASLENYQKNLSEISLAKESSATVNTNTEAVKETEKQRILTYVRNELMPISTEDIGYIYVENTITYIVKKDGKRSTTSESLDQIYSYLNDKTFFRANRQIIVAISAIDKITKFGNSKLKIQVNPPSEIDIVIGKNKASAFKQWLDL